MAGHERKDWFEREEFIGQISDMRVQNLQVEREVVQKRTFTRWMNLHLEKCDPPIQVHDLFHDIQDGRILMALLEELSGCKLLHGFKKSSHRIFRLNNIAKVLSFLEERNVKLVSIDAADVADGNCSIILGLIWNIILFFQIKELTGNMRSQFPSSSSLSSIPTSYDSDTSFSPSDDRLSASTVVREQSKAIKKLLQCLQKRACKFGVAVQDFGKSWISGLAFLAVIKSIDPSLVDMRKALLRTARENLEDAFRIAHHSLGIPRLLEPEDVTINAPDEQSIMTYASQFLEHFPGIKEAEDPCLPIERSISMCRLNLHDSDSDYIRNDGHRLRVNERSYMFQKDCAKPPPNILITSVLEDGGIMSHPFRSPAARSWSSEDFLADSPCLEGITSNVAKETTSTFYSPQLCCTHSPTSSSVSESVNTESVIGDSAISSPESWVESEFAVMPEKFCGSRSDSSLCDSGTAWDVYRASPVEITALDEGLVPSIEDRAPDEQLITDSYIDEGIDSLSSLESTQERIQGHPVKEKTEVFRVTKANLAKCNQDMAVQEPDHSVNEITGEVDSGQMETSVIQKGEVPRVPSFGPCDAEALANTVVLESENLDQSQLMSIADLPPPDHFEELIKQAIVVEHSYEKPEWLKDAVDFSGDVQDIEGQMNAITKSQIERKNSEDKEETERQKTDSPVEETTEELREESEVLKGRDGGVIETQNKATEGVLRDYLDPVESFNSEICDALASTHPNNQDEALKKPSLNPRVINVPLISISSEPALKEEEGTCDPERQDHPGDLVYRVGTDKDVSNPQNQDEVSDDSLDNTNKNHGEFPSCLQSENLKPTTWEHRGVIESGYLDDADEQTISRSSNGDTMDNMESGEAKQERESLQHDSLTGNTDKDFMALTSSKSVKCQPANSEQEIELTDQLDEQPNKPNDSVTTKQIIPDPSNWKHSGRAGMPCCEVMDSSYTQFDQNSPKDDLGCDRVEPMDLFYPDKEEPLFTQPPDTDKQSWPSVLSVSALQPAPASEALPDDQPLLRLGEEIRIGVDEIQENVKVIIKTNQEADKASESQENVLLPRERWTGSWELHVLLLLWLLLYCWWLLPQMDLKTLPTLLLNLHH